MGHKLRQFKGMIHKCKLELKTEVASTRTLQLAFPAAAVFYAFRYYSRLEFREMEPGKPRANLWALWSAGFSSGIILFPMIPIMMRIINEKNSGMRELIKLTGVSDVIYYGGIFATYFATTFVLTGLFASVALSFVYPFHSCILYITIFTATTLMFTLAFTILFDNSAVAVVIYMFIWIGGSFFDQIIIHFFELNHISEYAILPLCLLLPPSFFIRRLFYLEGLKLDYFEPEHYFLTRFNILMTAIVALFWWSFFLWYLEKVWPFQRGIPKPFYFLFDPSYWRPKFNQDNYYSPKPLDTNYFELEPTGLEAGIQVQGIKKSYGKNVAVKHVDLNVYHKQITVLLGHNGAGKTTTMNIITGMFPPSSGKVVVNGYEVGKSTEEARASVGLCTQHNVFFKNYTTYENLAVFTKLKGVTDIDVSCEVNRVLRAVKLAPNIEADKLSGGMKRRLQLGMCLVGGSKVLILDEPSSGLDVEARREVWDVLVKIKRDSLIFMTTHHMEEADFLGDRIAIMSHGEIKCCGSALFLRKVFDVGYNLRIAKLNYFYTKSFTLFLTGKIPTAKLVSDSGNEIKYAFKDEESGKLPDFYEELDHLKQQFGIQSYGVTVSSLDDVFLRVGVIFGDEKEDILAVEDDEVTAPLKSLVTDIDTKMQLIALLTKRLDHSRRTLKSIIFYSFLNYFFAIYLIRHSNSLVTTYSDPKYETASSVIMGLHFAGCSSILFALHERLTKAKFLQLMTGVHYKTYWAANFMFDFFRLLIVTSGFVILPILSCILNLSISIFFFDFYTALTFFFTYFLYLGSSTFMSYYWSQVSSSLNSGLTYRLISPFIFIIILEYGILNTFGTIFKQGLGVDPDVFTYLSYPGYYLFPIWPFVSIMYNLNKLSVINAICSDSRRDLNMTAFSITECDNIDFNPIGFGKPFSPKIAFELILMMIYFAIFISITFTFDAAADMHVFDKQGNGSIAPTEDSDVTNERNRIEILVKKKQQNEDAFLTRNLTKFYDKKCAVNMLTFGVHKHEIFGLLGVNGAGKTTTFQMLTGEIGVSDGEAYVGKLSLKKNKIKYQKQIGFCPQFDAILDHLTGRELLNLFARLRGVTEADIDDETERVIKWVDLTDSIDDLTCNYSGGNKRRLSLGIAIIAFPELLFLDEPTAGVDPSARRKIWIAIQKLNTTGSSVVISSHTMDECEYLCNRIGIMAIGQFKCLGSTQQILSKFGKGFDLIIKLCPGAANGSRIVKTLQKRIPSCSLVKHDENQLNFEISDGTISRSEVLRLLEYFKESGKIKEHQLSDKSLESVFLRFARPIQDITVEMMNAESEDDITTPL